MPQRQRPQVITLHTKEAQGPDSWIKVRRPIHPEARRAEQRRLLDEKGIVFDAQGVAHGGKFSAEELSRMGRIALAETVVEWNWVDDEDRPLPQPNPDDVDATLQLFEDVLTDAELDYLAVLVRDFLTNQAGTKPSGPGLRR